MPRGAGSQGLADWERGERGVPGNPRGQKVLLVGVISVWPSAGLKASV